MEFLYFFFLGVILTVISLQYNGVFKSKETMLNSDVKVPLSKIIFWVLIAWYFAQFYTAIICFFHYITSYLIPRNADNSENFTLILQFVNYANALITPFLLFKAILKKFKSK